jgi:hypothetical protein
MWTPQPERSAHANNAASTLPAPCDEHRRDMVNGGGQRMTGSGGGRARS